MVTFVDLIQSRELMDLVSIPSNYSIYLAISWLHIFLTDKHTTILV